VGVEEGCDYADTWMTDAGARYGFTGLRIVDGFTVDEPADVAFAAFTELSVDLLPFQFVCHTSRLGQTLPRCQGCAVQRRSCPVDGNTTKRYLRQTARWAGTNPAPMVAVNQGSW